MRNENFSFMIRIQLLFILLSPVSLLWSQDSTAVQRLSLQEADALFLNNNLSLLVESLQIEAEKAAVIQSKLYPNPTFSTEFNLRDPEHNKFFHVGRSGQKYIELEQLFILGGKRKTSIDLAKKDAQIATVFFEKLLLQLKYQLHTSLFESQLHWDLIQHYERQLEMMVLLIKQMDTQAQKGNIAMKEVVRLKSLLLQLNNEKSGLWQTYLEKQRELKILLHTDQTIVFDLNDEIFSNFQKILDHKDIQKTFLEKAPDFILEQVFLEKAVLQVQLEKKQRLPDVKFKVNYDQLSGAFKNEINGGISFDLPFLNTNRGNILKSKIELEQANVRVNSTTHQLQISLQSSLMKYENAFKEYQQMRNIYFSDFEQILKGMHDNFQNRNISLLEYVDFLESYNQSQMEILRIKLQLIESSEALNVLTGSNLI